MQFCWQWKSFLFFFDGWASWTHTFGDMEFYGIFHSHVAAVRSGQSLSSLRKLLCWREWQSYWQWLSLRLKPAAVVSYLGTETVKYQLAPFWFSVIHPYFIYLFIYFNRTWMESSTTPRTATEPRSGSTNLLSAGVGKAIKPLRVSAITPLTSTPPVSTEMMRKMQSLGRRKWAALSLRSCQLNSLVTSTGFLTPPLFLPNCSVIFTIYDMRFWSHDTFVTSNH